MNDDDRSDRTKTAPQETPRQEAAPDLEARFESWALAGARRELDSTPLVRLQ